jgi:hypothetical protein
MLLCTRAQSARPAKASQAGGLFGPATPAVSSARAARVGGAATRWREQPRQAGGLSEAGFGSDPSSRCVVHAATPESTRDARERGSPR